METNEIMVNDEIIETTEEIVEAGIGKGFKVVAGIGLAVFVGVVAYKYVVKPMWAKHKSKTGIVKPIHSKIDDVECEDCGVIIEEDNE